MGWSRIFSALALLLALSGCAQTQAPHDTTAPPGASVWVMSNGWHSDIILRQADIPPGRIPEIAAYPEARYFAFGWGDARYYPARTPTAEMAIRAIAAPTPAVLHLTAIPGTPEKYYLEAEVLRVPITAGGLQTLAGYLHDSFERDSNGGAIKTGPGLYRKSAFYRATGRFHLFNTCNTWAARGLMQAGIAVGQSRTIQSEALMRELRPIAKGESPRDSPELRPYYNR